jgi:hypothetical protein
MYRWAWPLVNTILFASAAGWIMSLEKQKCECSKNWRRDFLKWFFLASVLFQVAILFKNKMLIKYLAGPIAVASVAYLYVTLTYIHKLMIDGCDCTSGRHRTIMFWIALGQAFLLAGSIFVGIRK